MNTLSQLHTDIDARVQIISTQHTDWLCRKGCDACCRRLADIPRLTAAEWQLLQQGLTLLPEQQRSDIGKRIATLTEQPSRPLTCPMLEQTQGTCIIYAHRPIACRTYGFYRQRDKGLYCQDIETRIAAGDWDNVIWGNQTVIDRQLNALGDSRDLTEWFTLWQNNKT